MSTNLNQVESRYNILDFLYELDFVGSIKFYKFNCELCWFFFLFFSFYLLKKKRGVKETMATATSLCKDSNIICWDMQYFSRKIISSMKSLRASNSWTHLRWSSSCWHCPHHLHHWSRFYLQSCLKDVLMVITKLLLEFHFHTTT